MFLFVTFIGSFIAAGVLLVYFQIPEAIKNSILNLKLAIFKKVI